MGYKVSLLLDISISLRNGIPLVVEGGGGGIIYKTIRARYVSGISLISYARSQNMGEPNNLKVFRSK
jgi:hypothetical protein